MNLSISTDTWVCLSIIVVAFIVCLILVLKFKNSEKMEANRRIIEYFPTLVSTLGVLGTFWGITKGLMAFDTSDLDQSIPGLLDGLKTAFFTSLAGMIGSMFLSAFISKKQDERDGGISDINQAAGEITKSVKAMSDANTETMRSIQQQLTEQEADRKAFYRTVGEVMSKISDTQKSITSAIDSLVVLQRSQENSLADIKEATTQQSVAINSVAKYSQEVSEYTHHLGEILDVISGMSGTEDEINEKVGKLKEIIHGEVIEIEDNMAKTNKLLESKFDEFTELLKKSNTEALVEVMKKVTEEFQKQMNSLINKLIQENFDQLNKSVEKLNQWQQENKEMIASLTHQYREMSDNFEATSTSLTRVKDDTTSLVSEGGKLRQLVDALNQVIIEDERFIEVTKELHETANLSRSNMESFNESTKTLNEWVRKQRNFVDGVQLLIAKLEELNKIRDYGEQFWQGTKDKMEEGVGILTRGSQTLNSQLTSLDRQFYGRLSATLAELDNCITKMVEQVGKRR
ncbi:MAG: MotA/TolQ/ExbB proton channel family protein [Parabacteroides distasonis]|jgi:chromosome segregation ATPase|uniref:Chromosome partition protein Smc n=1 Tax=Parabacteroides distasonis TaxID=823 RepID=A0A6N3FS15_PARDI|nr:MotA/TolQ/ExbB proton channel family protein [Parabacteroides merdae]MCO7168746.1 MotA/TolQ/ExbB proton channel family protein [Parabacteroides merdae]